MHRPRPSRPILTASFRRLGVGGANVTSVLLHVCCGPCACGTIPEWRNEADDLACFFSNPNIHPFMEFKRRMEGAREVARRADAALVLDESYDPQEWFSQVSTSPEYRCLVCISMRLDRTAREAAARQCDCFTTSLSISPWQDHEAIKAGGEAAADRHGVPFIYKDLRARYPESRRLSREAGIYRQKYCGCLISEWERYAGK